MLTNCREAIQNRSVARASLLSLCLVLYFSQTLLTANNASVHSVKPDATDEEISTALEGGGGDIFTQHMLASKSAQAREALADVQEKHKDIQRLEKSIEELHQVSDKKEPLQF